MARALLIRGALLVAAATILLAPGVRAQAPGPSAPLEIRVTDHREGVGDFSRLAVRFERIALHRAGYPRAEGWMDVPLDTWPLVDLVPLKGGRFETIARARVEARSYDAVRVVLTGAEGTLTSGRHVTLGLDSATVAIGFVGGRAAALLVDLYVEDQTEHPGGTYVVKIRRVEPVFP